VGGSQLNAIELAAAVRDRGHHVTVFAARSGPLASNIAALGLNLVTAPSHKKRPSYLIANALRRLCARERIDIVHGYEWPPALEAFYGPLLFDGVSVGCTVMSMSVAPFIPPSMPLIVGTEQIAAATRHGRPGAVRVIEPPVDTVSNHPGVDGGAFRREHQLGDAPVVVLVSRLAMALKLEGLERAISAAGLLAKETGLRLVLVGDGPARLHLERLATEVNALSGEHTVILTGEITDPRAAYSGADIVLGMGGSALRAMAFQKPVVVLGELGFAQLLMPESLPTFLWQGFYGLGNGDKDPSVLADIMRPLLLDRERRRELGAYSRATVESRFSLVSSAERQESLYREWLETPVARNVALREGLRSAGMVLSHKMRRKWGQMRGGAPSEDFNAVEMIAKTAERAAKPGN
jgi:glycosyltransferase involved in cell wall biosynthesis